FTFDSQVRIDMTVDAGYMKHYVPIPDDIAQVFHEADITHVEGQLDDVAFRRVLHERIGDEGVEMCLKFGMTWLKQAGFDIADPVVVTLAPDPDPDRVDLPDELEAALADADDEIAQFWETLSPGKRKTLVYGIERAKRPETRIRRANKVLDEVRALYSKRTH
ncbi:MAG: YdeI/OmpD-associated family protein, partial [Chloroflexota bacterium]